MYVCMYIDNHRLDKSTLLEIHEYTGPGIINFPCYTSTYLMSVTDKRIYVLSHFELNYFNIQLYR